MFNSISRLLANTLAVLCVLTAIITPTFAGALGAIGTYGESEDANWTKDDVKRVVDATVALVDGTKEAIVAFVKSGGNLAEFLSEIGGRITTGLSPTISRIAGLVSSGLIGLLDTDVALGVKAIYEALTDKNPDTRGLYMDNGRRKQLENILKEIDSQSAPILPMSNLNGVSTFDIEVKKGAPIVIDPVAARGFEYVVDSPDVLIATFALPLVNGEKVLFDIEVLDEGLWRSAGKISSLVEHDFGKPVKAFRVLGIPETEDINDESHSPWVTMLSFDNDGNFRGSMTALYSTNKVSEPPLFYLICISVVFVFLGLRIRRP